MSPTLNHVIVNGASRHRIHKGFILMRYNLQAVDESLRNTVVQKAKQRITQNPHLSSFMLEVSPHHPSLLSLISPFYPVYTTSQRSIFIQRLANATKELLHAAQDMQCTLLAAGVNPLQQDNGEQPGALCADIHEIETFDDGEVERIYNLFRQFLPELLAISTHSAVYGGTCLKDSSIRMRHNPASFLPRYLSQFSTENLEQLRRLMRKDYGLGDLRLMDVNPIGGNASLLQQADLPLLAKNASAIELRFIDAQCSYAFLRAQMLLFQAIAMYGRSLARRGRRLPLMRDEVIDENKALALQSGAGATLKPDQRFKNDDSTKGYTYHDKGTPEVATTALLMVIDGRLLPPLQDLGCETSELIPIILGAELRRHGKRCFANYAEYQQYLCTAQQQRFAELVQKQTSQLLSTPSFDIISDYNRQIYGELAREIEGNWDKKLTKQSEKRTSKIKSPKDHSEKREKDPQMAAVAPPPSQQQKNKSSSQPQQPQQKSSLPGIIIALDQNNGIGTIQDKNGKAFQFPLANVEHHTPLYKGDHVLYQFTHTNQQMAPVLVSLQPRIQCRGVIKWFNSSQFYGVITQADGRDIYFHTNDLEEATPPQPGQQAHFQIVEGVQGTPPRPVRIRLA